MPYLFDPPGRTETVVLWGRSLVYSYQVSYTVFKMDGVWQAQETPATETLLAADRFLAIGGRPQTIDNETAAELIAAGIGTCTLIS